MNPSKKPPVRIKRIEENEPLTGSWSGGGWDGVEPLHVDIFREEGSAHRPQTDVKIRYNDRALRLLFRVRDQYVVVRHTGFQPPVFQDSCVEFFVRPDADGPYMNYELNAGGAAYCSLVVDDTPTETSHLADYRELSEAEMDQLKIFTTLPATVEPEIADPVEWMLELEIPMDQITGKTGCTPPRAGTVWSANFFKCADNSSHPHYATWSPITKLRFHLPDCFAPLVFE